MDFIMKPTGFAPRGAVREPAWTAEIMVSYW
jgi:hypothetical protein